MIAKIQQKKQALILRGRGKSLQEISTIINVAKSSVSWWCKDIKLTEQAKREILSRRGNHVAGALANKVKRQKEVSLLKETAKKEFRRLDIKNLERLKDLGTAIYWCEGAKRGMKQVDFTNSDPLMVKLMMNWFRKIHKVPEKKFRVSIYFHNGQNEVEMKQYWSRITGVPLSQFHKSMSKAEGTGQRKNLLYNGTCKIRICDCNLLHKILAWIEQLG